MVIDGASPYKCITVCVGFDLCAVNIEDFQCDQPFFFQAAQELVIQVIQYVSGQLFALKLIKCIPSGFLPLGEPDESQVPFA